MDAGVQSRKKKNAYKFQKYSDIKFVCIQDIEQDQFQQKISEYTYLYINMLLAQNSFLIFKSGIEDIYKMSI